MASMDPLLMLRSACWPAVQGRLQGMGDPLVQLSCPTGMQPAESATLRLAGLGPSGPPVAAFLQQLQGIYARDLARTSSCFQFVWFVNALAYYGVILLTTSVSSYTLSHACAC